MGRACVVRGDFTGAAGRVRDRNETSSFDSTVSWERERRGGEKEKRERRGGKVIIVSDYHHCPRCFYQYHGRCCHFFNLNISPMIVSLEYISNEFISNGHISNDYICNDYTTYDYISLGHQHSGAASGRLGAWRRCVKRV